MIITKSEPYTKGEIEKLREKFDTFVKTVIDINQQICSAGMDRHFEGEQILLEGGSKQSDIWGGSIDIETKIVGYNSFINIRPTNDNSSNEILDSQKREIYKKLSEYFFKDIYDEK
ncbi:MAG: hypothetical protein UU78_C0061G0015 [Candidatus Roizmanbacteria bacterium GW2011_GWC2_41_7]|uniref:Uncharacterized protein n=2 Tax=Candidatus Roizmaniibacteriota TaxID=1752723 RepID=A0A0G0X632_9BACT|nr:MAG: hypothetical protein UU41_C0029G0004 [Candidatus Roizmanbacteria bacterium GW2011_GWA1_41_13]KKS20524.1 MAG: hypothetical protein UU78_C0061G0015 [Candidatus Roizmanbacteria bacterium GW2011_GWC2_41_7]